MKHRLLAASFALFVVLAPLRPADEKAPRAIQLPDILAWKRINQPQLSSDGAWFAYRLSPNEGDSEIIVRNTKDGKEQRFGIGELPTPAAPTGPPGPVLPSRDLVISEDGKWVAFLAYPTMREGKLLRRQRRPSQSRLVLVELATGKKTEFEKIRRFAFSGERSTMLAMSRYAPVPAAAPGAGAAPAAAPSALPPGPRTPRDAPAIPPPAEDRATGTDMLLYDLATGNELNFGNVSEFAFDKKGNWLAWIVDANDKAGNGVQVMNVANGSILPLDSAKASYRGLNWTEKGDALASLRGVDDKAWEDKLYSVVAFRGFGGASSNGAAPEKIIYDPAKDTSFPKEMSIASSRSAAWNNDLSAISFGIHELKKKEAPAGRGGAPAAADESAPTPPPPAADDPPKPDLVIWHWKDSRLQSMQYIQEAADKSFSYTSLYRPAEKKFVRLADENLRQVNLGPEAKFGIGIDVRDYELESNLDGQRYEDVYKVDLKTGERTPLLKKAQWVNAPSPDASHILYYEDGSFFTIDLASGQKYNITKQVPASFINTEDDHNVVKPPAPVIGWTKDSAYVLLSDLWDIWKVPAHGGTAVNLTGNGKKDKIRYRLRYRLDPEERGIDLSQPMYVGVYGEWTKKSGFARIEPNQPMKTLRWEDAAFSGLIKAKRADVYAYTRETSQQYPNYRVGGSSLEESPAITDANPQQKDFLWTKGMRLVDYTSAKGDKLQGALYLPANYESGKTYPTIVYIYEKLSQGANAYPHPTFNGFNTAVYTSNGYAVFTPDIVYKVNDPGMSAVWCLEPAIKAAVATGVVDERRVGLHGHSWGGYQTAFTITQSKMFRAAIAGAPLTDMVSMYSSIYWNSGSANQPIFESSQGRFTSSYSENPEAYVRNSPVYHAKNVNTPLIILHNDKDGAVDFTQGIEYYNTLRRLGKQVVMLQYKGENHGLRKPENMKDYTIRMKEFFDYQLMAKEPPKWWLEGVPYLKMKDHLDERDKQSPKPATGAGAAMK